MNAHSFLFSALTLLAPPQESAETANSLAPLQNDPDLKSWTWTQTHAPAYAPFSLFAGKDSQGNACTTQEIEEQYAAALTALVDLWRSEWAIPLDLAPTTQGARAMLAFLPSFAIHKEIAIGKFPEEETVPGSYLRGEIAVTYLYGNAFESKGARQSAVLTRAGERLTALHRPKGRDLAAWLHLGLASYLGELRQKGDGRGLGFYAREESATWREALAASVEEMRAQKLPVPTLDELLRLGSAKEIENKPRCVREFARLSGYSLLLFWRARQGERFAKPFRAYLKAEFQGDGGSERLRTELGQYAAAFIKDWEAFCIPGGASSPPSPEQLKLAPIPHTPKKNSPSAGSLSPVALDMTPRTLIDLRAEVLRKVRSGRFDEALHEVFDVREKQSDILKPFLAAEKRMLESAMLLYEAYARSVKPGDRLTPSFGHTGEILRIHPDQSFEIRGKLGLKRLPWTALSLQAVAAHVFKDLQRNGPEETLDHATALLLCGNLEAAKSVISAGQLAGASSVRIDWLQKMIPDFERALKEARARDAIEEIASLELPRAVEKLRRRMIEPEFRASAAREMARPFLEGMLSVHFARLFDQDGLAYLFRGKLLVEGEKISLRYGFDNEAELADWERVELPVVADWFGVKSQANSSWSWRDGNLVIASAGARTHAASWLGDFSMRVVFETAPSGGENPASARVAGLCVGLRSGESACIGNAGMGNLLRFAPSVASTEKGKRALQDFLWDRSGIHELVYQRTGSNVSASCDGKSLGSVEAKEISLGPIFLFAAGEAELRIHEIAISGKLDTQSAWFHAKKAHWVQREVLGILGS